MDILKTIRLILILLLIYSGLEAKTLEIGSGFQYSNLNNAVNDVSPGDTILFHKGVYSGGQFVANLQGQASKWIYIKTYPGDEVIISGGGYSWMLSDPAYIHISGFIFEKQTGNGLNIDDAGSMDTPAHDLIIENCTFRDISATGNNDLLKLSGVDSIIVRNCKFINGAAGGSMIDMVGCHQSAFRDNTFRNGGSNSIQAKGGSSEIMIERNAFINGGQRAINIGGSTGIQFFRPQGVDYEASEIYLYSNIFFGSQAPIAFVGAIKSEVINNTIITPDKWVIRILQETTEPSFKQCQNNTFANNIVYLNNKGISENGINIGSNTLPGTFTFTNNLWYNYENTNWKIPNSTTTHVNTIFGQNPSFTNLTDSILTITEASPAIGKGISTVNSKDFLGKNFKTPPSIGAYEYYKIASINPENISNSLRIFPNPASNIINIQIDEGRIPESIEIFDINGISINEFDYSAENGIIAIDINSLPVKYYFVRIELDKRTLMGRFLKK